ncbi:hypothetical protein DIPPA_33253 [Diplonema papillatum]|nr:hypothetical protein DIPPA_33253 [Diplonema papillatum]
MSAALVKQELHPEFQRIVNLTTRHRDLYLAWAATAITRKKTREPVLLFLLGNRLFLVQAKGTLFNKAGGTKRVVEIKDVAAVTYRRLNPLDTTDRLAPYHAEVLLRMRLAGEPGILLRLHDDERNTPRGSNPRELAAILSALAAEQGERVAVSESAAGDPTDLHGLCSASVLTKGAAYLYPGEKLKKWNAADGVRPKQDPLVAPFMPATVPVETLDSASSPGARDSVDDAPPPAGEGSGTLPVTAANLAANDQSLHNMDRTEPVLPRVDPAALEAHDLPAHGSPAANRESYQSAGVDFPRRESRHLGRPVSGRSSKQPGADGAGPGSKAPLVASLVRRYVPEAAKMPLQATRYTPAARAAGAAGRSSPGRESEASSLLPVHVSVSQQLLPAPYPIAAPPPPAVRERPEVTITVRQCVDCSCGTCRRH